jgi:hypothetical protein
MVIVLDPLFTPVPPLDAGIVDSHVGTPVDPPDDKILPEDPYAPLNAKDPVAFSVIASVLPLLTMKWIALEPYVPIARSVDADAKYVHPAVLNPDPTNPDELIPNSPKFVVAVALLFDTLKFVDAVAPALVFCSTIWLYVLTLDANDAKIFVSE